MTRASQTEEKYLYRRGRHWWYKRRVPKRYAHLDTRGRIRIALNTTSIDAARMRRDALVLADDEYWAGLALAASENEGASMRKVAEHRYKAASSRAMSYGFAYVPALELAKPDATPLEDIVARADAIRVRQGKPDKQDAEALLGGVEVPTKTKTVTEAFELYIDEIAVDEQMHKSDKQRYSWLKTKRTSIGYFTEQHGDLFMEEITRDIALQYRNWWVERITASEDGVKPVKPNTANRHIGNMRTLLEAYFNHIGQEDRPNPFRRMFFKSGKRADVPPFENDWVRTRILVPGLFEGLNDELRVMIYVLIETGCRTSEICNLRPEDIRLGADIPHISITDRDKRELKTDTSVRDIPLVGIALEAMRQLPGGFPSYHDKGELVSANLMKAFRGRELFPTESHVIYSFRHAFEKRMQEANIDYGLRCLLMGHKTDRPAYGDGGSLAYRRDELLKIVHPYPDNLFR